MLSEITAYDKLPYHGVLLPSITIAPEDKEKYGIPLESTNLEFITQLCRSTYKDKVANRIAKEKQPEYVTRIKTELDTIETLGFTNYILMFWDICRFADESKIPRGPGRGSVSSSLVCYLLGITEADPIETGLFFTRFLSKARAKVTMVDGVKYVDGSLTPDIDMDFDYYRREEILSYLARRYPGQTSKLLTTTTFTSKILIKDVLKTYEGATEDKANEASDLIEKEAGIPQEIEDALSEKEEKENKRFKEWAENHKETCEIAMGLSGLNRSEGMHASALLICAYKIDDLMPLQLSSEKESVSGLDMYSAQEVVLKFDILGLKNLSVIADVCGRLGIKRNEINVRDPSIYRLLQNFKHRYGIFQLETFAQGNAAEKIHPANFEQLTACLAIARPGAFAYIDQYCKGIHEGIYNSIHPLIDDILKPTSGVCLAGDTELENSRTGEKFLIKDARNKIGTHLQCIDSEYKCAEGKIINFSNNGKKQLFKIKLRDGSEIRSTIDHKFLTAHGWKELFEMKKGDFLAVPKKLISQKNTFSKEKLRVIAYILGDGCIGEKQVSFVCKNESMEKEYTRCISFFENIDLHRMIQARNVVRLTARHKKQKAIKNSVHKFFHDLGLMGKTSENKFIPDFIFSLDFDHLCFFIASLWDCDGTLSGKNTWSYKTISKELAHGLKKLLLKIGIQSVIYSQPYECSRGKRNAYFVNVTDTKKMDDKISKYFINSDRLGIRGTSKNRNCCDRAILHKALVESGKKFTKSILTKNGIYNKHFLPKQLGSRINENTFNKVCDVFELNDIKKISNVAWSEIISIEKDGVEDVYDIEIEKHHNFIANNIITHNCIYQEQYLAMLIRIGMTPDEAETARKVLGKKQKEKVPEIIAKIEDVCKKNNHPKEIIDVLVKIAYDSGGYQFALAHSAAYAMLTAYTLYLKANHPLEFYWALLRMAKNESDSNEVIAEVEKEMRALGFRLLPPHFVHSSLDFKIEDEKSIRFGLGLIRGVSDKSMEKLESFRGKVASNKFEMFQSLKNSGLNIGIGSALIQAGCMDGFEDYTDLAGKTIKSRSRLVLQLNTFNILSDKEKKLMLEIGSKPEVNWDVLKGIKYLSTQLDEKGKRLIKDSRLETIRKKYKGYQDIYTMNSRNERLANFWYERRILGYSYSENLKDIFSEHIDGLVSVNDALNSPEEERVKLIGFVKEPFKSKTKAGNNMFRFTFADETGELTVRMFNDRIGHCEESNGRLPDEDDLVILRGKKMEGMTVFADEIGIQTTKIYLKLSELKDTKLKEENNEIKL